MAVHRLPHVRTTPIKKKKKKKPTQHIMPARWTITKYKWALAQM